MCELQEEIAALEDLRKALLAREERLNIEFWRSTTDAQALAIDIELDGVLEDLDALSDKIGTLQHRLDDLENFGE